MSNNYYNSTSAASAALAALVQKHQLQKQALRQSPNSAAAAQLAAAKAAAVAAANNISQQILQGQSFYQATSTVSQTTTGYSGSAMRKRRERIEKWRKEKNKNKPVSWAYFKNKL